MILKYFKSYEARLYFLTCFTIVGLVSSPSVMSIGVVAMFTNILLDFALYPQNIKQLIPNFLNQKRLLSLSFIFFASLLALSYSSHIDIGFRFVLNKLPLLVVPLAFSKVKTFSRASFHFILSFFVLTLFISGLFVLYKYVQNFEAATHSIKQGKAIWVPFNHIRYNVMLVFAFFASIYFAFISFKKNKLVFSLFAAIALFIFSLVHFLSVRSGLLVLYIGLIYCLFVYILKSKQYLFAFLGLVGLLATPFLAYHFIPSIQNKVAYTKYDWEQIQKNHIGSNSDSRRVVSYKVGLHLIKQNMPFGVGTGSLQPTMNNYYKQHYPQINASDQIAPHNQFMFSLLDCGILGLLALVFSLFYPLFRLKSSSSKHLYILFWIVTCTPLLFDISLEMQLGISFFALFSSLFLKYITLEKVHE